MRILISRLGAFGDVLILTPVIRALKKQGHEIFVLTSERGVEVLANNPNVDKILYHERDSISADVLEGYFEYIVKENKADKHIGYTETIEVELAVHPRDKDKYNLSKEELFKICNKNYYEHSARIAGLENIDLTPELFFTKDEEKYAKSLIDFSKYNVLCGLIGSGTNKFYPWLPTIINVLKEELPNINFITTGDKRCEEIETLIDVDATRLSGKITMRTAMCLTKYSDLVIAPDTGLLHASGCFSTPKIGILGHTTRENITKHFKNDYSIEADCECAPCMKMIYDFKVQCQRDGTTGASLCMGAGINPYDVIDRIKTLYNGSRKNRRK